MASVLNANSLRTIECLSFIVRSSASRWRQIPQLRRMPLWVSEAVVVYNNLVSGTGSLARGYANTMSGVEELMRLGTPERGEHQKRSG
jgi:hypothetical protein